MEPVLRVDKPGLQTTIQDLGRGGHRAYGVPPGGAMDRFALAAANRLVGNPDGAACLECAVSGPSLVALQSCLIAVTGADFGATVNGEEMPLWTGVFLPAGERLAFAGRRAGARCYIAVAGGFGGDRWLGSLSTYQLVGRGGLGGRPLKAGDLLQPAAAPPHPQVAGRHLAEPLRPAYASAPRLAAVRGPHFDRLSRPARTVLWKTEFEVGKDSDRMGYRLEGQTLEAGGRDILSIGLAMGAVQLPPGGNPILLMADHQSAGGYPVILGLGRADIVLAAQLLPGEHVSFTETSVLRAQDAWRGLRAGLETL
ncbi:MAG: biotin-dependent carboxyltransferase family protein [Chloroflexi bacterium]|nr:MAG: biotin-dependent carboxyltransferase family protein [Chloroflexota bacterium]TME17131.1 MAG: biotin-dependent carboxyltransferase family protein [Chloroflexota bacterium]TME17240.1 MAG: biotin-dependent carboxyltransferase family protein [Chloroflexota bacterium]